MFLTESWVLALWSLIHQNPGVICKTYDYQPNFFLTIEEFSYLLKRSKFLIAKGFYHSDHAIKILIK
ncbi:hypothetical protein BpHYR1_013098 [Brachionus plicatilis]|uniref:Uncharacterized protein n=1 Tax=Brachionus plicatilis TaxID=10195 RepID=A0A3M7P933_BRAPC|nr:hypothetical protein BpHYR1_013098 [Brachionus plicatilis]